MQSSFTIMKMNTLMRFLLITMLLSCFMTVSYSQESAKQKSDDFWKRVTVGGYLGVQIGNTTGIVISPEAQVRLVDQLYGGLGFTYQYYWYKDYYYDTKTQETLSYSNSVYGGRIFLRYYLRSLLDNALGNLFVHTEYEYLYSVRPYTQVPYGQGNITDGRYYYTRGNEAIEVNSIFIGGGYSQPVGGRAFLDILILYNLNESYYSPYSNPLFRIGFGVGL
jgi:hypothetical protein